MEYRILGPLEVADESGAVALGTVKERTVLAVLLLHANEVVSRERLIDELWGETAPPTAKKAVNVYVSKLRKSLTHDGSDPIETAAGGYRLSVDADQFDVTRVHELLAGARENASAGELEPASELFRQALALWRGRTLAGLELESFGRHEIEQLEELRLTALMDRVDCDLALGRHEQLIGELNRLVSEHPLRERLRAQQMLALYRADRQAEALDAYQQARQTLVEDLGIEPSEALQRLQRGILAHDPALEIPTGVGTRNGSPAPATPALDAPEPPGPTHDPPRRRSRRRVVTVLAAIAAAAGGIAAILLSGGGGVAGLPRIDRQSAGLIDPGTGKIVAEVPVGPEPRAIAVGGGSVWVANEGNETVTRIGSSSRKTTTITLQGHPTGLAFADGAVWAATIEGGLIRIDPKFESAADPVRVSGGVGNADLPGPPAVVPAGGALWVSAPDTTLVRVAPGFGRRKSFTPDTGVDGPLASGAGTLWAAAASFVAPIDPVTGLGAGAAVHLSGVSTALTYGRGAVWTISTKADDLQRIDPAIGSVTDTVTVGRNPTGVAVGSGAVWVTNGSDGTVTRLDLRNLTKTTTIRVGGSPTAVAAATDGIWVTQG